MNGSEDMVDDLITEGRSLLDKATPGPYEVTADNGVFAHLQSLYRIPKDGWRERVASNMQSRNAAWTAWLLNNGGLLLGALADARAQQTAARREFSDAEVLELARIAWDRENEVQDVPIGHGYDWSELNPQVRDMVAAGIRAVLDAVTGGAATGG